MCVCVCESTRVHVYMRVEGEGGVSARASLPRSDFSRRKDIVTVLISTVLL